MSDDILDEVTKHGLKKLAAKGRFKDAYDKYLSDQAEYVKTILSDDSDISEEDIVASTLSNTYYKMMKAYDGGFMRIPKAGPSSKRSKSFWHRVAALCISINVDPAVYLKAQFLYFRDNFGRAPEFSQLATASAATRAIEYAAKKPSTRTYVAAKVSKAKIPISEKMTMADKKVRAVCKAQGFSRFELYYNLVIPGFLLLPDEYLSADPEYKKALNA